jgi:hydrogenase maturation protease
VTPAPAVLVAGIGNVFLGDDGFGVEVVRRLVARPQPDGVRVVDFGIRGLDLAYALESCGAAIFVDAASRGGPPGTLYVIEPATPARAEPPAPESHAMTLDRVLARLSPEVAPKTLRLVACEPSTFDPEGDDLGLSPAVAASVDAAVLLVESLVAELLAEVPPRA